jgi:hypothetical protein
MKVLTITAISAIALLFSFAAQAETAKQKGLHDMHMMMRFMDHGLCSALQGADMQMLGQMGMSEKLDKDAIVHGTIMIKDGKAMIKEMLEGKAMQDLYHEGGFDQKFMDELHDLGERMIKVIDDIEKLHESAFKQSAEKK